jgi:hypothetical protein
MAELTPGYQLDVVIRLSGSMRRHRAKEPGGEVFDFDDRP